MTTRRTTFIERLSEAVHALDVPLPDEGYNLLSMHHELVAELEEIRGIELFPLPQMEQIVVKTCGSVLLASKEVPMPRKEPARILDASEQAAFPGLVFKMLYPDAELVVLAPSEPEAAVLLGTFLRLELDNTRLSPLWLDSGSPELGLFDVVLAPGGMQPEQMFPLVTPFLKDTGTIVLWGDNLDMVRLERLAEGEQMELHTMDNPLHGGSGYQVAVLKNE